jgi:hypothetical protein
LTNNEIPEHSDRSMSRVSEVRATCSTIFSDDGYSLKTIAIERI